MGYSAISSSEVDVDSQGKAELFQKIKDNFDYLYSMLGEIGRASCRERG